MDHISTQTVNTCPFCGSQNVVEIDRLGVINASSLFRREERADSEGSLSIMFRPINMASKQQFKCEDCGSCFETKTFNDDIEVVKER